MTEQQARDELRRAIARAGNQREFARAHQMSDSFVSEVLRGRRGLSGAMLRALGLRKLPDRFERIG